MTLENIEAQAHFNTWTIFSVAVIGAVYRQGLWFPVKG